MKNLIENLVPKTPQPQISNLPNLSSEDLESRDNNSISIYSGNLLPDTIIRECNRIRNSFPELEPAWYESLTTQLVKNAFSNQRLIDAVDNLINNCIYPNPKIALLISYDKRVRLFCHSQVVDLVNSGYKWSDFSKVRRRGTLFWMLKSEKNQYNILDEI